MARFQMMLCLVLGFGLSLLAQEEEKSPAEKFAAAQSDWEKGRKEVEDTVKEFFAAKKEDREPIRQKYTELVAKANMTLESLRTAAVEAYTAEPNKDEKVVNALVGLLKYDLDKDEYESALKLAKLLIDNKAKHNSLHSFAGIAAYATDQYAQADKWFREAAESGTLSALAQPEFEDAVAAQERFERELKLRAAEAAADDLPRVKIETNRGSLVIELYENEAPETVGNFISLVEKKYYDGLTFHRVLGNFMAQGGDPEGNGMGGPGYKIYDELDATKRREHFRGTLSMANSGPDSGGSQFFLTFRPTPNLDGKHTVFGRVVEGLDVLAKIQRRDPMKKGEPEPDKIVKAEVLRKRQHEYKPRKVE